MDYAQNATEKNVLKTMVLLINTVNPLEKQIIKCKNLETLKVTEIQKYA